MKRKYGGHMKIFEINTVCGGGSTGRIAADLARMLEEKGDTCRIAFARGSAPEDVSAFRFGSKAEIAWHGMMTRITDRHGMYSSHATKDLIAEMVRYGPDLIHLHNVHGYYLNIKRLFEFLRTYGKPVLWTLHDCWTYTGHCSHYTGVSCEKWKTQCETCPQKRNYPGSLLIDASRRNYKTKKALFCSVPDLTLVTPSNWLKNEVQCSFFGQPSRLYPAGARCEVIPNGLDLNVFRPREEKKEALFGAAVKGKKVVLGVANVWTEQKGFEDFIRLASMLGSDYQLVMAGVDETRKKRLPSNILAFSHTKNIDELAAFYSASDVYFNASIEETMGMTTGEAICCGTPVIVYRSTAVPESVGDGCGYVLKPGDLEGVKRAAAAICSNQEEYRNACLAYRDTFDKERAHEAYYRLYRALTDRKG